MDRPGRERALGSAAALLVFGTALLFQCAPLRGHDLRTFVLAGGRAGTAPRSGYDFTATDRRFAVWLVSHNARALVTRPLHVYDAEPCYPSDDAVALGHPGVPLGLLGVPAWLATGDPIATYNFVAAALRVLTALAMFLLVADWTGVPAAGIVAGLLYAFHLPGDAALTYPFKFDTIWALLGLFFGRRFFAAGRWRDGLALAVCCGLQLSESFYALMASALVAVPVGVWLVWHYGVERLRPARVLVVLGLVAVTAVAALTPIVEQARAAEMEKSFQAFATWAALRPGAIAAWLTFLLALAGLALPRRWSLGDRAGDPRWALAAAALLVALVVTGGNEMARLAARGRGEAPPVVLPNLYAVLSTWLPGLDSVRAPVYSAVGVGMALSVLAGFGAAALVRRAPPRLSLAVAIALIGLAWADALRPGLLGLPSDVEVRPVRIRPVEADLAFFETLAREGNRGPLFEIPVQIRVGPGGRGSAISQVLLSTYHQRRTSGCYNSILPPETRELVPLADALPAPAALAALRERGFTTIVVHRSLAPGVAERLETAARDGILRRLHADRSMTAYALDE